MLLSNAKVIIILIIFYIKKKTWDDHHFSQEKKNIVIFFQDGKPCGAEVQKLKNRKFHMPLNFVPYN